MKKSFAITWISQTLVIFSLVFVVFTAGIIVYNQTGSLISFSLVILSGYVPELIVIPLAGSLVDRVPRKSLLIGCSLAQALLFTLYFLFLMQDASDLNITYTVIAVSSAIAGVHRLSYNSSIALFSSNPLVYPRLNGMVQAGLASAHILAPLTAGFILEFSEEWIVAAIAATACTASAIVMVLIRFPELSRQTNSRKNVKEGLILGFQYIKKSPGLLQFLFIHAFSNFARGSVIVLFTPFVLTFSTESALGSLRATAGAGMAVGSILISVWGGPNKQLKGVIQSLGVCGIFMVNIGITKSPVVIGFAAFALFVATPILAAIAHAIWQHQVPVEIQGRVFSVRDTIAGAALATGYVVSPWLADIVFVPLSKTTASGLGGTYIAMGLLTISLALFTSRRPSLRDLK